MGMKGKSQIFDFFVRHISVTLLSICIMGFFGMIAMMASTLDPLKRAVENFSFTDIYYNILMESTEPDTSRVITIVDMTKITNRSDMAQLLQDIETHNPKVVGLDVCFDNEGEDFEGNDRLIQVAEEHKNIIFSQKMLDWKNDSIGWTTCIHSFFHEITDLTEGTTNMPRSSLYDSMKRKAPLSECYLGKRYPSFIAQVVNHFAEQDVIKGRTEEVNINFNPTVFRVLKPEEVASHPEIIENQIVLVGAMYEDVDTHWTPIGKIAGVELLAYAVQSVLFSNEVRELPTWLLTIFSLLIIFVVQVLQHLYLTGMAKSPSIFVKYIIGSSYFMSIFTFLFTSLLLALCFLVFKKYNLSINLTWAATAITFLGTSRYRYTAISDYFTAWKEKRKSRKA